MSYPKTEPKANFLDIEKQIAKSWQDNKTFNTLRNSRIDGKVFRFFDGPATPSSIPHAGHMGVSAVKDMVCRYHWMKGENVQQKLGWDVHGLPTEVMVEKATGKQAKDLVAELGLEKFCDMCKTGVMKYVGEWNRYLTRVGRWVDIGEGDIVYNTMYPEYMESVISALKKLHNDGLLYKDFKVNPYDWKLGTVMSNSEASSEYQDAIDDAVTVWFELSDGRRILAWTTTPWTLPANSALAVNPDMKYAEMKDSDGHVYIIAESRMSAYTKQFENAEQIGTILGKELVGLKYKPLFDYYKLPELYSVIPADYVSDSDGTGIVHIAPAFGEDDYLTAKALDPKFPVILNVDDYGNFTAEVTDFAGQNIFEANPKIIEHIKKAGFLVKKEQYKHSYPFSPRSKEKLIYRATDSWYINVPAIREKLIANNNTVSWKSAGERFAKWIENARAWGISRNRFWGVPLPIWEKDGDFMVLGPDEIREKYRMQFGAELTDWHRPTLDKIEFDGYKRIPDVLDAWFESGSMPYATNHHLFDNKPVEKNPNYVSHYIIEGQDQTRGWFYTLMVLSTALFDQAAFKDISANGMTVDEHKKKMSKSLGNYFDPMDMFDKYGADAFRLFILGSNFMKAEPVPVDKEGKVFGEVIKTILTPLWNAYHFFTLYANARKEQKIETHPKETNNLLDLYIQEEITFLTGRVEESLNAYKPDVAVSAFIQFLDILNNWYIRLNRERFWNEDQDAFNTLHFVLTEFCKLLAPFAPFISDYIYMNLTGNKNSVHLEKFPERVFVRNTKGLNAESVMDMVTDMRKVQSIVSVGKQLRETSKLRNRLPLQSIKIAGWFNTDYSYIIKSELNVRSVEFINDINSVADSFVYLITPKIGARLGGQLKEIIPAVKKDGMAAVEKYGLLPDEYETRLTVKPGVTGAALTDNTAVVVLDTELTPELIAEGLANDALRFIQDTRKTVGLDVSDRIILEYAADDELAKALRDHIERIQSDALITEMNPGTGEHQTEIEGHKFSIKMTKA